MRFALSDNKRIEAQKGLKGLCPYCMQSVIPKCGEIKNNHWAHRSKKNCDSWWEPETDWHRAWKNNYPAEWQEVILPDGQTGEKHIADVRTAHNLVIEFQHSHINPEERTSRERFYKNMVWVVDGTRLQRDYPRFRKGAEKFMRTNVHGVFFVDFPDEVFPKSWINSSVPVIFDFRGIALPDEPQDVIKDNLWCLLPAQPNITRAVVVGFKRDYFVERTRNHARLFPERPKEQRPIPPQQQKPKNQIRRPEPTHYLDSKGRWKRRRRL